MTLAPRERKLAHAILSTASTIVIAWAAAYAHAGDLLCIQVRTLVFIFACAVAVSRGWGYLLNRKGRDE